MKIPQFLLKYAEENMAFPMGSPKFYGKFAVGEIYDFNNWISCDKFSIFPYKTHYKIEFFKVEDINDATKQLCILITESAFLLFEKISENSGKLKIWASLFGLSKIERNIEVPKNIIFHWFMPNSNDLFKQEYFIEDADNLIKFMKIKMKNLGLGIEHIGGLPEEKNEEKKEIISPENNIKQILEEIEKMDKDPKISVEIGNIQKLLDLYQKAIEYYSALGDPKYDIYLKKMKEIMKRGDIQKCLQK